MKGKPFAALVTGGAGFIGSHLVDSLVAKGCRTRILDNLLPQAHPNGAPAWLNPEAELIEGDLRDRAVVDRALEGVEVVFHQGGIVGNGQSMFDIRRYVDINVVGTANLIEAMLAKKDRIRRVVVASSMVVYGDGAYRCPEHGRLPSVRRPTSRLLAAKWEPVCPTCDAEVEPIPTPEDHTLAPTSTYGISKRDQEELSLVHGRANELSTIALRYLNVYGSRQALSNPYTGVAAIIATRLLHRKPPALFEDAQQRRDFCHVSDVVEANLAAAEAPDSALYRAYNIGTGRSVTLFDLSRLLARELDREDIPLSLSGEFREGDIRHCFADVSMAKRLLNWEARVTLEEGISELARWARDQNPIDHTEEANAELRAKGLIRRTEIRFDTPERGERTIEPRPRVELPPSEKVFGDGLLADLVRSLKQVPEGELLAFTASKNMSDDLIRWAQLTGNAIVGSSSRGSQTRWVVRRGTAPAQGEDRPIGSRIWLYTNFHCNLACSYCCVRSSPKAPRRELGLSRVRQIAAEARELGVREIFVTGGEPFLLEEIDQILLACAATAPTVVLTNGMLFQGRQLERLRALPRERLALQISLDSPTPELHDLNRGKGSWSRAMEGIRIAREEGFRVRLAATLATDEAEASFVKFLDQEGVAPEDRILRRIALRGFAAEGIAVAQADLWPEPTFTADGVYWHPVGAEDGDLFVRPELFPIRDVFEKVRELYQEQRRVHAQAASVFHCA